MQDNRPITPYDLRVIAGKFGDVYKKGKGWKIDTDATGFANASKSINTINVAPIGHFNAGKTWVVNRLSGKNLPYGNRTHTEGLSIALSPFAGTQQIAWMDTAGLNSPVESFVQSPEDAQLTGLAAKDKLVDHLRELKRIEEFHRLTAFEFADAYLFVIGQMSHQDQLEILMLVRQISNSGSRNKQVFVVHNLQKWTLADLEKVVPQGENGDGYSYIDRVKTLFFMQRVEVPMEVMVDSEMRLVIDGAAAAGPTRNIQGNVPRLHGAFGADGDTQVQMLHVFLCNNDHSDAEKKHNAVTLEHLRRNIGLVVASKLSVKTSLERVMTKVQVQLAEVTKGPPLRICETGPGVYAVHAVNESTEEQRQSPTFSEVATDWDVRNQPLELPSYLTLGSDDLQFNILKLQGTVAGGGRRGANAGNTSRSMYAIEIVLPGLTKDDVTLIESKMSFMNGALRLEAADGKRVLVIDFSTVERVAHAKVAQRLQAAYTRDDGEGIVLLPESIEEVVDEGTRAIFSRDPHAVATADPNVPDTPAVTAAKEKVAALNKTNLHRLVPVQLQTGLTDVTTLTKPLVAYNDGVLSIVVTAAPAGPPGAAAARAPAQN